MVAKRIDGQADLNNDGIVGVDDVLLIITFFGQPCEDPLNAPVVTSDSTYGVHRGYRNCLWVGAQSRNVEL